MPVGPGFLPPLGPNMVARGPEQFAIDALAKKGLKPRLLRQGTVWPRRGSEAFIEVRCQDCPGLVMYAIVRQWLHNPLALDTQTSGSTSRRTVRTGVPNA